MQLQQLKSRSLNSKQTVKIMIIILVICVISSNIHDLRNRHLIDEENEDEKRI